jgi:cellulose biosynthesis protein BcsQ
VTSIIAIFNNKGGVSKTTTCFNVGWMLAERGHRVVMVDADPQCNLTGMVLDLSVRDAMDDFYLKNPKRNLKDALEPAFASRPKPLEAVECIEVEGRENLFLIPGHVGLSEYDVSLGLAQQVSESVQTLKNLPGSFRYLFEITAERYSADYVLVDLSPGLGSINQNLVTTSDFFAVPLSPDVFSVMALESLARVVPRWVNWGRQSARLEALADADYPFKEPSLKFLGTIVQRYKIRGGEASQGFRKYFEAIDESIDHKLIPAFEKSDIMLPKSVYDAANLEGDYRLANIPDFNSLIAYAQKSQKPVFALDKEDMSSRGIIWKTQEVDIVRFREIFGKLAERIERLTGKVV